MIPPFLVYLLGNRAGMYEEAAKNSCNTVVMKIESTFGVAALRSIRKTMLAWSRSSVWAMLCRKRERREKSGRWGIL